MTEAETGKDLSSSWKTRLGSRETRLGGPDGARAVTVLQFSYHLFLPLPLALIVILRMCYKSDPLCKKG